MKNLILTLVFCLISNYAWSANWINYNLNRDDYKTYYDAESIQITGGNFLFSRYLKVWEKTDYLTSQQLPSTTVYSSTIVGSKVYQSVPGTYTSKKVIRYYDCGNRKTTGGTEIFYLGNSSIHTNQNPNPAMDSMFWEDVIPDTVGSAKLKHLCTTYADLVRPLSLSPSYQIPNKPY